MRLVIREDLQAVAFYTANYVRHCINQYKPTAQRPFVLGLPTGSIPVDVYWHLVDFYKRGEVSFRHVVTFNMDEYVGLPQSHPGSYCSFMRRHLFDHVDLLPENIHMLDGNADDLSLECQRYEELITEMGGIELFLGGIGPDGHIAFNEPGSSLESVTRIKTLAHETVLANARFFDGDINKVPKFAMTVGVGTFRASRDILLIITGAYKAMALAKCIEEGINHMWTLSVVQTHKSAMVVCDEDATLELHMKTVRYFKSIEQVQEQLIGRDNIGLKGSISKLITNRGVCSSSTSPGDNIWERVEFHTLSNLPADSPSSDLNGAPINGSHVSAAATVGNPFQTPPSRSATTISTKDEPLDTATKLPPQKRSHSSDSSPLLSGEEAEDYGDEDDSQNGEYEYRLYMDDISFDSYPHLMAPYPAQLGTTTAAGSNDPSHPGSPSSASFPARLTSHEEGSSVYPANWHEYESQYNYLYNRHFVAQSYYNNMEGTNSQKRASNDGYFGEDVEDLGDDTKSEVK